MSVLTWENEAAPESATTLNRGLTHLLDLSERQAMPDRTCSVPDCERSQYCRDFCRMHYKRLWRYGDPLAVLPRGHGADAHRWQGEDIGYSAAHMRVRAVRGPASAHPCLHCDGPAAQWAFDHGGNPVPMGYSPNPAHYIPLCASCHKRFDTGRSE